MVNAKWQAAAMILLAIDWPIMNSIEYGLVSGIGWDVLMFGLVFLALACAMIGARPATKRRRRRRRGRRYRAAYRQPRH